VIGFRRSAFEPGSDRGVRFGWAAECEPERSRTVRAFGVRTRLANRTAPSLVCSSDELTWGQVLVWRLLLTGRSVEKPLLGLSRSEGLDLFLSKGWVPFWAISRWVMRAVYCCGRA
jgi:hypothetical protein